MVKATGRGATFKVAVVLAIVCGILAQGPGPEHGPGSIGGPQIRPNFPQMRNVPIEELTTDQLLAQNCIYSPIDRIKRIREIMMVSRFTQEVMEKYTSALKYLQETCPRVEDYSCPENALQKIAEMNQLRTVSIMTPEGSARFEREFKFYETVCTGEESLKCTNFPAVQKLLRENKYTLATFQQIIALYRKLDQVCRN